MDPLEWRVLLIDDDEDDAVIVNDMLSQAREGRFILEWVSNVKGALDALKNRPVQAVLRGLPPDAGPQSQQEVDERNWQAVAENRSKGYEEVLRDFELSCINLSNTLELLSDEDLFEQNRFQDFDDEPVWQSIAIETYEHFEEHDQDLDHWKKPAA